LTNFSLASKYKYFGATYHSYIIAATSKVIIIKVKTIQPLMSKIDENFTKTKKYIFTKINVLVCSSVMKFGWNVKDYNGFI
jgi:hypothetical protein